MTQKLMENTLEILSSKYNFTIDEDLLKRAIEHAFITEMTDKIKTQLNPREMREILDHLKAKNKKGKK